MHMPKKSKYTFSTTEIEAIQKARRANRDKRVERRLNVLEMLSLGREAGETASVTGFHRDYVYKLSAKYRKGGIEAITGNHYRGNRRNLPATEEEKILEPFRAAAEQGQVVEVSAIREAYERACGRNVGNSQIYRVLKRHGWRKVMPRSRHPRKADDEAIDASKKLNKIWTP